MTWMEGHEEAFVSPFDTMHMSSSSGRLKKVSLQVSPPQVKRPSEPSDHSRSLTEMTEFFSTNRRKFGRCFCIITGASKGFGRALAQEVGEGPLWEIHSESVEHEKHAVCPFQASGMMDHGSVLVLAARSGPLLHQLKEEVQSGQEKDKLTVHCVAVDLAAKEGVDEVVEVARQVASRDFDHVLLVNNAGEAAATWI